jgi:hypothetical protein
MVLVAHLLLDEQRIEAALDHVGDIGMPESGE